MGYLFPVITSNVIVFLAIFGFVAAVAWFLLDLFSSRKPRAEERLDVLKDPRGARVGNSNRKDAMAKVLERAAPRLAALQPRNAQQQGKLRRRLDIAGFRSEGSSQVFVAGKLIGTISGLLITGATSLFTNGFTTNALVFTLVGAIVGFILPDVVIWILSKQRKEAIFLGLPDALDLMVVCVEAGLGLDQAMRKVADEMKHSHRVIAEEFSICNFHLQMGKERKEVLTQLGSRNGVDDLRALASTIIQAEKFGSSVGRALRVQSDSMRTKRQQIAEEKAAKTAVQLLFPLVLFIFPGIFVVLVGPAAILIMETEILT